ncbi:hypothetical protein [Streptomyces sp. NBC_01013]|uniref:hypothetical protein n=1 Tax=Streptomyces sp. NBC_01013 TaxID=2903718 RepID=UPI003863A354|nr:hypothetical protein OG538_35980 [Streptomyces sp. NBC_01013]
MFGAAAEPVGERIRQGLGGGLLLQRLRVLAKLVGVLVGAGDVRAGRLATIEPRGIGDVEAVAQGPVAVVDAHQEGARVVVDGQGGVRQDVAGLAVGADRAGERRCLGGGVDRAPGGRPGDARLVGDVVVDGGEGVGGGPGGLDVEQFVDAVAAPG